MKHPLDAAGGRIGEAFAASVLRSRGDTHHPSNDPTFPTSVRPRPSDPGWAAGGAVGKRSLGGSERGAARWDRGRQKHRRAERGEKNDNGGSR